MANSLDPVIDLVVDPIVIVNAIRSPIGSFQGALRGLSAPQLGAAVVKALLGRGDVNPELIDELLFGCVLPAGLGQAPARQVALGAGLGKHTCCSTINKMCGSGMQAVILANDMLLANSCSTVIAGGMESMSNAPYLLPKARAGYRMGHGEVIDHMFFDGLQDAYDHGRLMGSFAEDCAKIYDFTREAQDDFAIASLQRAQQATTQGYCQDEIAPLAIDDKIIDRDEQPFKAQIDKIRSLKPAFAANGTLTAANSSSISDGAAALLLMRSSTAKRLNLQPLAKICGHAAHADEPALFATAPVKAIEKLMTRCKWSLQEVDVFEINEAFAVVPMIAMRELDLPHEKVNIYGGACALGHPIGASGARILVTLINALRQQRLQRGVAAICIGGGEATAVAIECMY